MKNASSARIVPIADELVRLGFLDYVQAIRSEGHFELCPELHSERGAAAKKGDTFYKRGWLQIRPHLSGLKRGQAMHCVRHTVSTELKELGVHSEFRADLAGHSGHGETETRYSKATRLGKLTELVNMIPNVTSHISAPGEIRLLSTQGRQFRPMRVKPD